MDIPALEVLFFLVDWNDHAGSLHIDMRMSMGGIVLASEIQKVNGSLIS